MIRCASCGSNNPDDNNFCDQCGAKLINTPSNTESVKYANNPFESSNSSSSKEFNNPFGDNSKTEQSKRIDKPELEYGETIKKCSRCSGTGKIKEKVPSMFGETYEYKTCPKCHGIGKYIVDENGKHRDIISYSSITSSDSAPKTDYSNQNKATKQINYKLIIGLVGGILGYIVLFNILGSFGDKNKDKNSSASVSASSSTTTETSSKSTHETLSDSETATVYYNDLSFELPGDWLELPLYDDLIFRYGDKPGPDCQLRGYYYIYGLDDDDPVDFEQARENVIENGNYYVENGDYSSFEYEDIYIGERQAIKAKYQEDDILKYNVFIDYEEGYIDFSFSLVDYIDEFEPVVENIIDSINTVDLSESTSDSSIDIEFTSYSYKDLTCEIPADWVITTSDSNTDTVNIIDNPDSAKYAIGFGFLSGDLSLSNDEVKEGLISANEGVYDVYENEDCEIGNHTAVKLTCEKDSFVLVQYLIEADGGVISIGFGYDSIDEAAFEPIMDYVLSTCSFESTEENTDSETEVATEATEMEDPLEGIKFTTSSFNIISYEIPSDWYVIDYSESSYSNDIVSVDFTNSDEDFLCNLFYQELGLPSDIPDFADSIADDLDDSEIKYTKCGGYDAAKVYGTYDNDQISYVYFVSSPDGIVMISFYYSIELDSELTPIVDYIFDSVELDD